MTARFVRHPSIVMSETDGVVTLMHIDTLRVFALNSSASSVWQELAEPNGLDALLAALDTSYCRDSALATDVAELLAQMTAFGAVVVISDGDAAP